MEWSTCVGSCVSTCEVTLQAVTGRRGFFSACQEDLNQSLNLSLLRYRVEPGTCDDGMRQPSTLSVLGMVSRDSTCHSFFRKGFQDTEAEGAPNFSMYSLD